MKKLFLITAVLIPLLTACPDSNGGNPDPSTEKTTIVFDNTQGTCAITVYSNYLQSEGSEIASISAGGISEEKEWPSGETSFFFSYQINFKGIDEFTIDYVPQLGKDQKREIINPNIKNTIYLPPLAEALTSLDTLLSSKSHLFIQNNSSYELQLLQGNNNRPIPPDNKSVTVVNSRERPQYTIDPAPASNYQLVGTSSTRIPFPASLVRFEAGRAYYFVFNNNILSLVSEIELIPGNVDGLSLGKARVIYYWINDNLETTATAAIIPAGRTVTITAQGTDDNAKQWYLNGINTGQSGNTYEFSDTTIGVHTVDLFVEKDGRIYNTSITITVETPYTVTFDANGGSGTVPDAKDYVLLGSSITLPDASGLTMSGYIFSGWNTNDSGTGTNYNAGSSYTVPGNVILYAKWERAYTITFNANGGSGTVPAQTVTAGSSATLPGGSGLARTNYTFGGWNTNDSGTGTNYAAGSSYTPDNDVTLYAMWFPNNATSLTAGNWSNGEITSTTGGNAVWYSFNVVLGNTYKVYWNDRFDGDPNADRKTLEVKVSAYYSSGTSIFTDDDDGGFTIPQEFTATSGGRVLIKVEPLVSGYTGTFAVRYTSNTTDITITFNANGGSGTVPDAVAAIVGSSITLPDQGSLTRTGYAFGGWNTNASGTGTNYNAGSSYTVPSSNTILYARWLNSSSGNEANPIPLTAGVWTDGSITSTGGVMWYSFYATGGTTYYIWWNDSYEGNSTKTLDVIVSAYNASGTSLFTGSDSGWSIGRTISVSSSGTVKIKVEPYSGTGTFAVAYSTGSTRPGSSSGTEANPFSLTAGIWANGSITSTTGGAIWYSFSVTSGTRYYIWWNDRYEGDSTKTLDVKVSVYNSNGASLLSGEDSGWNGWDFTPGQTGTVKIKVEPYTSGYTGTFAVAYGTGSTRP